MIDLYTYPTPNGRKVSIMLEEIGLPYAVHVVDITKGEQFKPDFLALNPNNKIPVIVDHDGPDGKPYTVFESGAILIYLADKTGSALLPRDRRGYFDTLQWLMFQMGGLGPMFGQNHFFRHFASEKIPFAIERYTKESERIYGVMNKRLAQTAYLAGAQYSIADIAAYPWVAAYGRQGIDLAAFPEVRRWHDQIAARPAVQRGFNVPPPLT